MRRKIELLGCYEVAKLLGVPTSNLSARVAKRPGFPAPVARLRCGPVWLKKEVERYKELRFHGLWLE